MTENLIPDNATINQSKHAVNYAKRQNIERLEVWSRPGALRLSDVIKVRSLVHLNIIDTLAVKLEDFVGLIKSMHSLKELSLSGKASKIDFCKIFNLGDFHLVDLTARRKSDMVFNESMKRPLEQLRLKWNGSNNIQESSGEL